MIRRLSDFSDLSGYRLPFVVIRPSRMKYRDISIRVHDMRWPTLWFVMKHNHREFRVKEFFLDWFFPGFPKALMRDFASTYSKVVSFYAGGYKVFLGKDYHAHDSASAFVHGTQLEVVCREGASEDSFKDIFDDLLHERVDPLPLADHQFPDRSHFAKGYEGTWYEEQRVSRLDWFRTPRKIFWMPGHELRASGTGRTSVGGKTQEMFILEEREYRNAIRIEISDENIELEHANYNIRKGDGFYDVTVGPEGKDYQIVFRSEDGPGILNFIKEHRVWTVGFSPGFSMDDIEQFAASSDNLIAFLEVMRGGVPQEIA